MQLTVERIRTLKGAPLSILMALVLSKQPVTSDWLQAVTGYSDKSVTSGLKALQEFGYITRNGRYAWQLAGEINQLPLMTNLAEEPDNQPGEIPGPELDGDVVNIDSWDDCGSPDQNSMENRLSDDQSMPDPENFRVRPGEIPSPDALASLESLTSFKKPRKEKNLARGEPDPEIFRILDENGIREPARSQIANQPEVSARLVAYHCKTAPNTSMAIWRIQHNWRVPKHWQMPVVLPAVVDEPDVPSEIYDPLPEDLIQRWDQTLALLEGQLSRADFHTWVKAMKPLTLRKGVLVIRVANSFAMEWLEANIKKQLEDGLGIKFLIEVSDERPRKPNP
ncbi:MAG: hypothetical protein CL609_22805 [Anaerolineaceae bacterium]|nr:hypothetical protein [Anaerolineaceae bacterium]